MRDLCQRHPVELGTEAVAQLGPEVAPVHVRLLALFLELASHGVRAREHLALRLLSNNGDVPLMQKQMLAKSQVLGPVFTV